METLSLTAKSMSIGDILDRFQGMRDSTQDLLSKPTEPESDAWEDTLADLGAIDAATAILTVLMDEGIWNAEQAKDLIFDYTLANRQLKEMHRKYETPTAAERSGDTLLCPECHARLGFTGKHCGQCGKRIAGR